MSDHAALPALKEVMEAAGFHDLDRALAALAMAETALGKRFHQSREALQRSRDAAHAGQWEACWRNAHQATHTLTGPLPPDISMCAPRPDDAKAHTRDTTCACGVALSPGVRYCSQCGTKVT